MTNLQIIKQGETFLLVEKDGLGKGKDRILEKGLKNMSIAEKERTRWYSLMRMVKSDGLDRFEL